MRINSANAYLYMVTMVTAVYNICMVYCCFITEAGTGTYVN